jgi:GcrA cell cycle regulator
VSAWTPARLAQLQRHFEDGLTCRQSAERLGLSCGAVMNKRLRLALTRAREPDAEARSPRPLRVRWLPPQGPRAGDGPLPEIWDDGADFSRAAPLTALGPHACRWPLEPTMTEASMLTLFCGQAAPPRRPYCPPHAALAGRAPEAGE